MDKASGMIKGLRGRAGPCLSKDTLLKENFAGALQASFLHEAVIERVGRVHSGGEVQVVRVHAGNGKEHVPGEFPLDTHEELLVIALFHMPHQLVRELCVQEACRKRRLRRRSERVSIPLAVAGNLVWERVKPNCAVQIVSEIHDGLIYTVLKSTNVQPIPGEAPLQDHLA